MAEQLRRIQALPRQAPNSIEAEQSVLGGLLLRNEVFADVAGRVSVEDFYRTDHQAIYRAIAELIGASKQCDFLTVTERLRELNRLEDAGGASYIGRLAAETYSIANILSYADIVRERAGQRALIAFAADVGDAAYETHGKSFGELATDAERALLAVTSRGIGAKSALTFAQVFDAADKSIARAIELREAGATVGVPTGFACIDERTGGMREAELWLVAARPSLGKSAWLNQVGIRAARAGHPGLICSLEMSADQIGRRAMAHVAGVNLTKLGLGFRQERDLACEKSATLGALPLYLDTESYELNAICAQITHYRRKYGIKWAAVDHIGLVDVNGYKSRNDELGKITKELKRLAKTLGIGIFALSQLNRNVEKDRRRPLLSDLRDSGNIEQDAVVAMFLHTDAEDSKEKIDVQFGLLKNRDGRRGWITSVIEFEGATQTFTQTDRKFQKPLRAPRGPSKDGKAAAAGDDHG